MERAELMERLKGYEWDDVELKRAQRGVPESAYETVSAFSNTDGGSLVFGVQDRAGRIEIVGVIEVDKVQNDFLSVLRSGQKLNRVINARGRIVREDGRTLLIFRIPEARRQDKPVYLNGDIRRTFLRRGAADEQCTPEEIERLLRDAADDRYDGQAVELDLARCFHAPSVRWYRRHFADRYPDHDREQPDTEFLHDWGLVVESQGELAPTRAAVLLFGSPAAFRQLLPRPVVDWQWHRRAWTGDFDEERWADRLVVESNLVQAWQMLRDRYIQRTETPFAIDPETLQRQSRPPDYAAFREAAINLLIHQDYAEQTRKAVIHSYADRMVLWNPGDAFSPTEALLEPGEKEVRNPKIVAAFRRIGLSEQAGTGLRTIFGNQRELGHVPPAIDNDRTGKAFQIALLKEYLVSEQQLLLQAKLGVPLSEAESRTFAYACRQGRIRPRDVRAATGLTGKEVQAVLERLTANALIAPLEGSVEPVFALAPELQDPPGRSLAGDTPSKPRPAAHSTGQATAPEGLSTEQPPRRAPDLSTGQPATTDQTPGASSAGTVGVAQSPSSLTHKQDRILRICDTPRRLAELLEATGMTNRGHFKKRHLDPMIESGVLRMTHPDQKNHPQQAYVLTEAGAALKARRMSEARIDEEETRADAR